MEHCMRRNSCRVFTGYRRRSGFAFGLNHIVEVLTGKHGSDSAARARSTFDLRNRPRCETGRVAGNRTGIAAARPGGGGAGKFATLHLTEAGLAALRERKSITLTTPFDVDLAKRREHQPGEIECDEVLFERLRALVAGSPTSKTFPPTLSFQMFLSAKWRGSIQRHPASSGRFRRGQTEAARFCRDIHERDQGLPCNRSRGQQLEGSV